MLKAKKSLVSENVHWCSFILSAYCAALGLHGSVTVSLKYSAAVLTCLGVLLGVQLNRSIKEKTMLLHLM